MKIELSIPPGERQQSFLDHLNSSLRTRMSGYSGQSGFLEDGTYVSEVSGSFRYADEEEHLSFAISKSDTGVLTLIDIAPTEGDDPSPQAEEAAREFVLEVMKAALADSKEEFFSESLFLYVGPHLDGEYWLPGFRLAPAMPDDGKLIRSFHGRSVDLEKPIPATWL